EREDEDQARHGQQQRCVADEHGEESAGVGQPVEVLQAVAEDEDQQGNAQGEADGQRMFPAEALRFNLLCTVCWLGLVLAGLGRHGGLRRHLSTLSASMRAMTISMATSFSPPSGMMTWA